MALYENRRKDSSFAFVETLPQSDGNFTFFTLNTPQKPGHGNPVRPAHEKDPAPVSDEALKQWQDATRKPREEAKQWLASMGQTIVSETVVDGRPVLVTHGDKNRKQMMAALKGHGDDLTLYKPKVPFSEKAWQTGATLAFIGQGMQMVSSYLRPDRKADWALRGLAIPNLIATTWILLYGAQRSPATHRMNALKTHFNEKLDEHALDGAECLPNLHEKRSELRKEVQQPATIKEKTDKFLKENSVWLGEIVMRYGGAFALGFAPSNWKKGWEQLMKWDFKKAYEVGRTASDLTHYAGLASLTGKTIALSAKSPDTYDPKPHTALDSFREKVAFRSGGVIETLAFGAVAADALLKKKISFKKVKDAKGKFLPGSSEKDIHRDWISFIGGSLFTIRYVIRWWAPFGKKELNMNELDAHVTDSLAQMPPGKLPQLLADTAADITDHFKDQNLKFGEVYQKLTQDLYKYHHIALNTQAATDIAAKAPAPALKIADTPEAETPIKPHSRTSAPRKGLDLVNAPAASHTEDALRQPVREYGLSA